MRQMTIIMDETQAEELEEHTVGMPAQVIWHAPMEDPGASAEEETNETAKAMSGNTQGDPLPFQKAKNPGTVSAYQKIMELHGSDSLRNLCCKLHTIAPELKEEAYSSILDDTAYLFSVESCIGINARISLFFDFLNEEGLLANDGGGMEIRLQYGKGPGIPIATFKQIAASGQGSMYSLDLSSWMDHLEDPEFRDFLYFLYGQKQDLRYVFRIPYVENEVLQRVSAVLSDIFTVETVSLPPMTQQELEANAAVLLKKAGYMLNDDGWSVFRERIAEEKSDSRFYGMNTIQKVVHEIILLMLQKQSGKKENCEKETSKTGDSEGIPDEARPLIGITAQDLKELIREKHFLTHDDPMTVLNEMIGIDEVRNGLNRILENMEHASPEKMRGILFVGNPGTGRTAVARILGELLTERGVLKSGFFEHTMEDLMGDVIGETVPKTMAAMRDADEAVLFLDEVFREKPAEQNFDEDDEDENIDEEETVPHNFRKEALETLISMMELHPKTLVIIAATKEDAEKLFEEHPALKKCLPEVLSFRDFTREELCQIFKRMVLKEGFSLTQDAETAVQTYFRDLPEKVMQQTAFSNARYVRNLYERTRSKLELRSDMSGVQLKTITQADFRLAAAESSDNLNKKETKKYPLGFRLET